MLSHAAVLLALAALARSAPAPAPAPTPTAPPASCSSILHFQSGIREALQNVRSILTLESALIPVNTMEKGCIHSHLTALLSALNSHDSSIARKLENVHDWTKQQSEFHQGSDEKCKTVEAMKTTLFKSKTLEFLKYLYKELHDKSEQLC